MARWRWWCAVVVISSAWVMAGASAAEKGASSAEGTITAVDVNRSDPTLTVQLSTGRSMTLLLGRIGAWESLRVGSGVRLRYTDQKGVSTIESIEIATPAPAATGDAAAATPAPSPAGETKKTESASKSSRATDEAASPTSKDDSAKKKEKQP